jgi:septal ring factor EnvC (AmiA/AmiB activator)
MISCETDSGVIYITKIEDFQDLVKDKVYSAFKEFVNNFYDKHDAELESLKSEIEEVKDESDDLDRENDDLRDTINRTEKKLEMIIKSEMTRDEIIEEIKQIQKYL